MQIIILNQDSSASSSPNTTTDHQELIKDLWLTFADLKSDYLIALTKSQPTLSIKDSAKYQQAKSYAHALQALPILEFSADEQKAVWINIYNALVVHAIIELQIHHSVHDISRFFQKIAYNIGGKVFTLYQIEHGVLRGNQKPPAKLLSILNKQTISADYEPYVLDLDPRIHFALNCGASSCPPISCYAGEKIDKQLDLATRAFISSGSVVIDQETNTVQLSKLFSWYKTDFLTNAPSLIEFITPFVIKKDVQDFLTTNKSKLKIKFQPYNWNLVH